MEAISFFVFLVLTSGLFALAEVQIEGTNGGWAANLPTWRVKNRWTRLIYGEKPLTGYHFYLLLFMLVVVHLPFGMGFTPFTWQGEARALSFFTLFWVLEDFLWFAFNPAYGVKRFKPEHIWWHAPGWFWIMPRDYWIFTPVGLALYWLSQK